MVPVGTNSAASFPRISAARSSRRFTVGSSPYTSSPTSASAMARRISGVGLVTVSERRSTSTTAHATGCTKHVPVPDLDALRDLAVAAATDAGQLLLDGMHRDRTAVDTKSSATD